MNIDWFFEYGHIIIVSIAVVVIVGALSTLALETAKEQQTLSQVCSNYCVQIQNMKACEPSEIHMNYMTDGYLKTKQLYCYCGDAKEPLCFGTGDLRFCKESVPCQEFYVGERSAT